jgi:hypothetical protein
MSEAVYLACAAMSLFCMGMLIRSYRRTRHRLLFWSSWCFAGLALNNVLLFIDLVVFRDVSLYQVRTAAATLGLVALVYGLLRETA